MSEELAGAGFGQPHEVFDFQVVVEFGFLVSRERGRLMALDEVPDALARCLRRLEVNHFAGTQRGDELDEFFVRSQAGNVASARRHDKRLLFTLQNGTLFRDPSGPWKKESFAFFVFTPLFSLSHLLFNCMDSSAPVSKKP